MCGRFTLRTPAALLASWFQGVDFPVIAPRFNIAPTQRILALRSNSKNCLEAVLLRWGLVPSWAADLKIGNQLINARSETAASKPAFRRAFKSQRCIILADGFYEWKQTSTGKQPFLIQSTDIEKPLLCFAGLWETWRQPSVAHHSLEPATKKPSSKIPTSQQSNRRTPERQLELFESRSKSSEPSNSQAFVSESDIVESCTILTTAANERMAALHDRMPVILDPTAQTIWLDREFGDYARLGALLQPCPNEKLRIHSVSKLVNKASIDEPGCAEPVSPVEDP